MVYKRQLFFQYSYPSGCDTSKLLSDDLKNKLYYDSFQKMLYHYSHHIIAEIMDCHSGTLTCLFPDELALLVFDWDCLNLSIYHPSAEMQQLLAPIAASEGLFFRAAET